MWQYKVEVYGRKIENDNVAIDIEAFLDSCGKEGWELVSAIPQIDSSNYLSNGEESFYCVDEVKTDSIVLFFKKPL